MVGCVCVCVCVCAGGGGGVLQTITPQTGKSILPANGNDVPTSITIRETLSESSLNF